MKTRLERIGAIGLGLTIMTMFAIPAMAVDVPRMGIEELQARLGDPDFIILDVRARRDWETSERKIIGAIRENPSEFDSWVNKYSKENTFVLYCA